MVLRYVYVSTGQGQVFGAEIENVLWREFSVSVLLNVGWHVILTIFDDV